MNTKLLKLKQLDLIEITWLDAYCSPDGWVFALEIDWKKKYKNMIRKTTGLFLKETPEIIAVCQSYQPEKDSDKDYEVDNIFQIPKGAILKIEKKQKERKESLK